MTNPERRHIIRSGVILNPNANSGNSSSFKGKESDKYFP
jgi:hypothetical protein